MDGLSDLPENKGVYVVLGFEFHAPPFVHSEAHLVLLCGVLASCELLDLLRSHLDVLYPDLVKREPDYAPGLAHLVRVER